MADTPPPTTEGKDEPKQCRICLAGPEDEETSGRLIKPCMCKGSMKYVHVKCLNKWRLSSNSRSAFYSCNTCHYSYAFARTRAVGLATSPVVLGVVSLILFTAIVFLTSFLTTFFVPSLATPAYSLTTSSPRQSLMTPIKVANRIISYSSRVYDTYTYNWFWSGYADDWDTVPDDPTPIVEPPDPSEFGLIARLIHRFILGLSAVGSLSFVTWLWQMSLPGLLRPFRWRSNSRNNRRDSVGNVATILILVFIVIGIARTIRNVYNLNRSLAQRMLSTLEDVILEVA